MTFSAERRSSGDHDAGEAATVGPASPGGGPFPRPQYGQVVMGHGGGGRLSADLIEHLFIPGFGGDVLARMEDQATVRLGRDDAEQAPRLAFTTDSFVVKPLFFPGGDIGKLAVYGTINDLAVGGAEPLYLSSAFILEEGFALSELARIVRSMGRVRRGRGPTGHRRHQGRRTRQGRSGLHHDLGRRPGARGRELSIRSARPGDRIVVSGTMGDHGVTIMSVREGLAFDTELESDCAPLIGLTRAMLSACPTIRAMRDPTRGGLTSALNELAVASRVGVRVDEPSVPVRPEVRAACEMLGLDPLSVANEGKLIAVVPAADAPRLVAVMRSHPLGRDAALIGEVVADHPGMVTLRSSIGERILTMPAGEQLPRIC